MTSDGVSIGRRLWRALREGADAAWMTLATDRLLQASVGLAALFAVLLLLPVLPEDARRAVVGWVGPAVFALLIPYAFLHGDQNLGRPAESAFWRDLVLAAWSTLAAVVLRRLAVALDWDPATLLSRLALVVSYTLVVVAVERQPHRDAVESRRVEMRLTLPTILLLVVGLFAYFVILPLFGTPDPGREPQRMSQILAALGALLVIRVGYLAWATDSVRWRTLYGVLGLMATTVVLLHGRTLPIVSLHLGEIGLFSSLLWIPPMLLAVLLARLRLHPFPAERRDDADMVTRLSDYPAGLALRTMFVALAVPVVHFGAYRFGLFDQNLEAARETLVFFWIVGLGAVAVYQNRRLSDRLTAAFRERRRIENALANTERSLRLADARRQSEEAVWSKKEKYVKAFRYSPDATLLTTVDDGRLLEFNNRFLDILGYRREQVTGRTVFDLGLWPDPAERERLMQALREDGQVRNREVLVRTGDDRLRRVRVSAELLEVAGDLCLFAVARDVTAQEESLSALQRQAALLDRAVDPVLVLDRADAVTYVNPAAERALRRSAGELRGMPLAEALDADGASTHSESVAEAGRRTREAGVWRGDLPVRGRTTDSLWTLVTGADGAASAKLVLLSERRRNDA